MSFVCFVGSPSGVLVPVIMIWLQLGLDSNRNGYVAIFRGHYKLVIPADPPQRISEVVWRIYFWQKLHQEATQSRMSWAGIVHLVSFQNKTVCVDSWLYIASHYFMTKPEVNLSEDVYHHGQQVVELGSGKSQDTTVAMTALVWILLSARAKPCTPSEVWCHVEDETQQRNATLLCPVGSRRYSHPSHKVLHKGLTEMKGIWSG